MVCSRLPWQKALPRWRDVAANARSRTQNVTAYCWKDRMRDEKRQAGSRCTLEGEGVGVGGSHVHRGLLSTSPSSRTIPTPTLFADPSIPRQSAISVLCCPASPRLGQHQRVAALLTLANPGVHQEMRRCDCPCGQTSAGISLDGILDQCMIFLQLGAIQDKRDTFSNTNNCSSVSETNWRTRVPQVVTWMLVCAPG